MQSKRHFLALDGLRGVAAIAVAIGHLVPVFGIRVSYGNTALAVDFFFMLSGFVLAHAYGRALDVGGFFGSYFSARVIRLYPLIIVATALAATPLFAKTLLGSEGALGAAFLARLIVQGALLIPEMKPNGIADSFLPLNPPAWSLFFEMVASTLYGIGIWRGRLGLSVAIWLLSAMGILFIACHGSFDTGFKYYTIYLGMIRVAFGFGTGVLLHRWWATRAFSMSPVVFAILAMLLPVWLLSPFTAPAYQLIFVAVYSPVLIIAGACYEYSPLKKIFTWSGELSYPLYIIHWPIYGAIKSVIRVSHLPLTGLSLGLTAVATAVFASIIALKLLDEPIRRRLSALRRRRTAVAPSVTPS